MKKTIVSSSTIPPNDVERLEKLQLFDILDTPADETFDRIAALAAEIFDSPIAQVTFVDQHRTFFKSNLGTIPLTEVARQDSLCAIAIQHAGVTLFEDIQNVKELSTNPMVKKYDIRFYAGAPLQTTDGFQLGTVCVLDTSPKEVTVKQLRMLQTLAAVVMDELEMRLNLRKAMRAQTDMMNRVVHDLKNPNTTITLSAELIKKKTDDAKIVSSFADRIRKAADGVLSSLDKMLGSARMESGNFRLNMEETDLLLLLENCKRSFSLAAAKKNQQIFISCDSSNLVMADKQRLGEAFEILLRNALHYSYPNTTVNITVSSNEEDKEMIIEFKDQGQGLTTDDMPLLFSKFTRLSAVPTGREHTNGLGLSIVKMLIEQHKGKVWAESDGKGKGASFFIALPA